MIDGKKISKIKFIYDNKRTKINKVVKTKTQGDLRVQFETSRGQKIIQIRKFIEKFVFLNFSVCKPIFIFYVVFLNERTRYYLSQTSNICSVTIWSFDKSNYVDFSLSFMIYNYSMKWNRQCTFALHRQVHVTLLASWIYSCTF